MTDAQTTYDRATSAYDKDHERALMEAITRTIFETSAVSDADAIVIRTAKCAQALVIVLADVLAMSPAATRLTNRNPPHHRRSRQAVSPADRRDRGERGSARIY